MEIKQYLEHARLNMQNYYLTKNRSDKEIASRETKRILRNIGKLYTGIIYALRAETYPA